MAVLQELHSSAHTSQELLLALVQPALCPVLVAMEIE